MTSLVSFDGVSKRYRRGRERINLRAALPGRLGRDFRGEDHWALEDVSFTLDAGQSLGLIGANGAGKSTALKLVAGVITPTRGRVRVLGKTASLIELGAGFHPDMTGRENLYFSAAVLGMGSSEVRGRFDEIVAFADIGEFLDTPVKRYSSGMLARLGFAVATHLDVDVLVLDEVLAVGDGAFQRKCFDRINHLTRSGVALIYVTHAVWTVPMLCQQAILLAAGRVVERGQPVEVVEAYERLLHAGALPMAHGEGGVIRSLHASPGRIAPHGALTLTVELQTAAPHPDGVVIVFLADDQLKVYASVSSEADGISFARPGRHRVRCNLERMPLQPGPYQVHVAFAGDRSAPVIDDVRAFPLEVTGDHVDPSRGTIHLAGRWELAAPAEGAGATGWRYRS